MNIKLLVVGKTDKGFVQDGTQQYVDRLKHYIKFEMEVIPDLKNASSLSVTQLKEMQAQSIIQHLSQNDNVILLDEHGKSFTSMDFAQFIQQKMNLSVKNLVFIVGGAFGFADKIKTQYKEKISISPMTFSHQMIRLLFTEQLYRAFTIINHEPYHNE